MSESKKSVKAKSERQNTSVYVTGLPSDVTEDELHSYFSKCGILMEDLFTGRPKIKIYKNEHGISTGDALIVYFKPESIDLAIDILDDSFFRPNVKIGVQKAQFLNKTDLGHDMEEDDSYKKDKGGAAKIDPHLKKQKLANIRRKLEWFEVTEGKKADSLKKMILLKNLFDGDASHKIDPVFFLDLKEDMMEECSKLGEVTKIHVYEQSLDGSVSVKFKDELSALACVQKMNGRFYAGRRIVAAIMDSEQIKEFKCLEKTKGSMGQSNAVVDDGEEERLNKFGNWLEGERHDVHAHLHSGSLAAIQNKSKADAIDYMSHENSHGSMEYNESDKEPEPGLGHDITNEEIAYARIEENETLADRLKKKRKLKEKKLSVANATINDETNENISFRTNGNTYGSDGDEHDHRTHDFKEGLEELDDEDLFEEEKGI